MLHSARLDTLSLLYANCVGTLHFRRIEGAFHQDLPFWDLTDSQQPDYSRISEFRHPNLVVLNALRQNGVGHRRYRGPRS